MTTPTRSLTTAIASGDTEAFARFYEGWFDVMYAQARSATGRDEAFCLDVVQDAMLRVIKSLKPIDDEDGLRRWLRRVVKSTAIDRLRRESRRAQREAKQRRDVDTPTAAPAETAELVAWVGREIASMDDTSAQLVHLRHRAGWSLPRIAKVVGMPVGTVHRRINRIMSRLRERAREHLDE